MAAGGPMQQQASVAPFLTATIVSCYPIMPDPVRFDDAEAWRRMQDIELKGQPVKLRIEWSYKLLVVVTEPLPGFIHLCENPEDYGADEQYHSSVAKWPVATEEDFEELYRKWHGVSTIVPIERVRNEGFLKLAPCPLLYDVAQIHDKPESGWCKRKIHVNA